MIARKAPSGKERGRRSSSRLGAVRLRACEDSTSAEDPADAASSTGPKIAKKQGNQAQDSGTFHSLVLKSPVALPVQEEGLQQHSSAVVGQENPWEYVQDAFRRLADPSLDSGSPLSLDTLMSGRPALLDKGLGAINAVGKAAVHVANSLDNAVETLFEGWNGPAPPLAADLDSVAMRQRTGAMRLDGSSQKRPITPQSSRNNEVANDSAVRGSTRQSKIERPLRAAKENAKPAQEKGSPSRPSAPQGSSAGQEDSARNMLTDTSRIRQHKNKKQQGGSPAGGDEALRLQQMQEELAALQATKQEYLQLQEQMNRVQGKLNVLSRENELLKENRSQEPYRPPPPECDDPLAEQVAGQLQALLQEKARLASENARLAHENTSLQELLEYTVRSVDSAPTDRSEDECSSAGGEGDWGDDTGCVDLEAELAHPPSLDMHSHGADQGIAAAGAV